MEIERAAILNDAPPDKHFWTRNGSAIKNLRELLDAIEEMDEATFRHHVDVHKNDFSEWIRHVFKDEELAADLSKTILRKNIIKLIKKRIKKTQKIKEKAEKKAVKEIQRDYGKKEDIYPEKKESSSKAWEMPREKIEEILQKEREIEERIEKRLEEAKNPGETKLFSKEFVQGIIVGLLLATIAMLVYTKFFVK